MDELLEQIVADEGESLLRVAWAVTGSTDAARDLVQDCLERARVMPAEVTPSEASAVCPSTRAQTASDMRPASAATLYWKGVRYVAVGASPGRGAELFRIGCEVGEPPRGQEWVTPWPDGSAAGFPKGTIVYRASNRTDDCVVVAQPFAGEESMLKPDGNVPGC